MGEGSREEGGGRWGRRRGSRGRSLLGFRRMFRGGRRRERTFKETAVEACGAAADAKSSWEMLFGCSSSNQHGFEERERKEITRGDALMDRGVHDRPDLRRKGVSEERRERVSNGP